MSNILYCCVKDPKGSPTESTMEKANGHVRGSCPFSESEKNLNNNKSVNNNKPPNLRLKVYQPIRLKNHLEGTENSDVLHSRLDELTSFNTRCTERVCQSSVMEIPGRGNTPRTKEEVFEDADVFLREYFASIKREDSDAHKTRIAQVEKELDETGTYQLKTSELVFGAKLAWRNASRCIGRIQWKKLQIFDCREVTTARGMFEALCNHIKYATNKGNIRSAITIFPQRTDGKHDYRIWNPQLISYAGYVDEDGTIIGDPAKVEITDICIRLGWKPPRTPWDILPLVLSADGKDPEYFQIPKEIIMEVQFEHPEYDWFKELGLRWYAVPAVSNMKFDCGGLEFTGTAFNGWYMSTEIGCRNLSDVNRLNVLEKVALKMGLKTNLNASLWKDKALVEVNIAVLHSFHRDKVSIVDHHSASEQFISHLDAENKIRGGCPSDWVWIVPPMSSSLTSVFHQEMSTYYIRPSYDYQDPPWKFHKWSREEDTKAPRRKFHFKQIARAVKFTSKLFSRALSKRIKATILYATETGKSEQYAKELGNIFGYAFNAHVQCMADYDMFSIEHETLLVIVASTFGNGEPPTNGVDFAEHLFKMLYPDRYNQRPASEPINQKMPSPKTLMRTNSIMSPGLEYKRQLTRLESTKSNNTGVSFDPIGPLSNVCYAVFALGSSAYPKFCNFGKTVDSILHDLGGERILDVECGDEMYGQEQTFRNWSSKIFHVACETFCLDEIDTVEDAKKALGKLPLTEETVRFGKTSDTRMIKNVSTKQQPITDPEIKSALDYGFKRKFLTCSVVENLRLGDVTNDRETIYISMKSENEIEYEPGDHVAVAPCNRKEIVDTVLERCKDVDNCDKIVQLQVMKETLSPTGTVKTWEQHGTIPKASIRDIFSWFMDITTPPSTRILKYLADACTDKTDSNKIKELIEDSHKYDDWRHLYYPNLGEVLDQFPSCKPQASLLAALLPTLQPRLYSISSSPVADKNSIHVTVSVVAYNTENGKGPTHYGVCSNYLKGLQRGENLYVYLRRAPNFYMPTDISAPLILVGPGTGVAPFRGFWRHRRWQIESDSSLKPGPIWLFFGCRSNDLDLYREEKNKAIKDKVLTKSLLALSREPKVKKKYVQDLLEEEGEAITRMLLEEDGHFYVCGDCKMAEDVQQRLKGILKTHAKMSTDEVEHFILTLMDENRYHEDIFGITLRTAEVHSASRESAKRIRLASIHSQP